MPPVETRYPAGNRDELGPEPVRVRTLRGFQPVHDRGDLLGWAERMSPRARATATLTGTALILRYSDRQEVTPLDQILSIQPTSSSLQLARRDRPLIALRFANASIRLWERVLQIRVAKAYQNAGRGEIVEFQPVIRTRTGSAERRSSPGPGGPERSQTSLDPLGEPERSQMIPEPGTVSDEQAREERARTTYRLSAWIVRTAWPRIGGLHIHGLQNVPAKGAFLLVCNHQSDLDPALIQSIIPRPVYAVAKSGLFLAPAMGWLVRRLHSIPVRRFQVDPQAVRTALRLLAKGRGVAIYIEGERSWDGKLQDYRPGTIRLALKAGVPIIPVAISGSYDASPRWDSRIQPRPVTIRFLEAIRFPKLDHREDRERELPAAAALLMSRLADALDGG